MSDLLSEKQSISSGFLRNLDDTGGQYVVDSAGKERVSKSLKDYDRVKKFERGSSKSRESMSFVENAITKKLESSLVENDLGNNLESLIEEDKVQRQPGSSSSIDEGVSSSGDKDEDNDDAPSTVANETDDEGRGSWIGDKNRYDSDMAEMADSDTDLRTSSEEEEQGDTVEEGENADESDTERLNLQDSGNVTIGDFQEEIFAGTNETEEMDTTSEKLIDGDASDHDQVRVEISDDEVIEYAVIARQDQEEAQETSAVEDEEDNEEAVDYAVLDHHQEKVDVNNEDAKDSEVEEVAKDYDVLDDTQEDAEREEEDRDNAILDHHQNVDVDEKDDEEAIDNDILDDHPEDDADDSNYNGDVEDTPIKSMNGRKSNNEQLIESTNEEEKDIEKESEDNEFPTNDDEINISDEGNGNFNVDATGTPEEGAATENVVTNSPKRKVKRTKKKSRGVIDLEKITANRIPISIRTTPVPISRKKNNANLKPRLNSKFEHQNLKKLKERARKKRSIFFTDERKPIAEEDQNVSDIPLEPPVVIIESSALNSSNPTQGQSESRGMGAPTTKESSPFLNPLMDHTLQRPVAPHKRVRHKTTENVAAVGSGNVTTKVGDTAAMEVKNPNSEVWVPGEDKLYVYSYSSAPRLLHVKRLGSKRVATTTINDTDPNSSFRIKNRNGRVIRGTNYGKDGAPKWNPYFAYARCLSQNDYSFYETDEIRQRREEFRKRMKERARVRKDTLGLSSVYQTPSGLSTGNQNSSLEPTVSPEEAIIKALVANTLREAAVEVSSEAEVDAAKMEQLVSRRLSTMGEEESPTTNEENYESDDNDTEPAEDDVREDPDGMETSHEDGEILSSDKEAD